MTMPTRCRVLTADPDVVIRPLSVVVTVGQSVTFTCNVSGHPLPSVTQWSLANDRVVYAAVSQPPDSNVQVCTVSTCCIARRSTTHRPPLPVLKFVKIFEFREVENVR